MDRSACFELRKGPWSPEEDEKLFSYIKNYGHRRWKHVANAAGLRRCGRSCRLRWTNYLNPHIKRGPFTEEEDDLIIRLHSVLGNKWSKIASHLPRRTDNEIKNHWNSKLRKKLIEKGIDPVTHMPKHNPNNFLNILSQLVLTTSPTNLGALTAKLQFLNTISSSSLPTNTVQTMPSNTHNTNNKVANYVEPNQVIMVDHKNDGKTLGSSSSMALDDYGHPFSEAASTVNQIIGCNINYDKTNGSSELNPTTGNIFGNRGSLLLDDIETADFWKDIFPKVSIF